MLAQRMPLLLITDQPHRESGPQTLLDAPAGGDGVSGPAWYAFVSLSLAQVAQTPALVHQHPHDLILLDCQDTALVGRLCQANPDVPLVVVADIPDAEAEAVRTQLWQAGATDLLVWHHLTGYWLRHTLQRVLAGAARRQDVPLPPIEQSTSDRVLLEAVIEHLPVGVLLVDAATGHLLIRNRQARESGRDPHRLGAQETDPAQMQGFHVDGTPYRPQEWPLARTLLSGEEVSGEEIIFLHGNGSRRVMAASAIPLRDQAGRMVAGVGFFEDISRRKQAEEELYRVNEECRALTNIVPGFVWTSPAIGPADYINERWYEFSGTSRDLPANDALNAALHPDDAWWVSRMWAQVQHIGADCEFELRLRSAQGEYHWFLSRAAPLRDSSGRIVKWFGISSDITAHKRAEATLVTILERIQDYFIAVDRDWHITYINNRILQATGKTAAEVVGQDMWVVFPTMRDTSLETNLRQSLAEQQGIHFEDRHPVHDAWFSFDLYPSPEGLSIFGRDITARKQAEMQLRARVEEIETLMDLLPVGVFIAQDPQGEQIVGNRMGYELLRQQPGSNLSLSAPPDERPMHFKALMGGKEVPPEELPIQYAVRNGVEVRNAELEHVYDDGTTISFFGAARPLFTDDGRVRGAIAVFVDISERKAMEEELRLAHDELEQRVAERTQALLEVNQQLQQEIVKRALADKALAEVRQRLGQSGEAERLYLAQELHDGALQELSVLQYQLSALAPALAGTDAVETLASIRAKLREVSAQLRHLTQELRPPVLAHYGLAEAIRAHVEQMQQAQSVPPVELVFNERDLVLPETTALVLLSICQQALRNALQHARASQLTIRLAEAGGQVTLEVQDNGVGFEMPEQWADLVRQGHLGVAGMAERAASIGGQMEVDSAPGVGTTIRVWMPTVVGESVAR